MEPAGGCRVLRRVTWPHSALIGDRMATDPEAWTGAVDTQRREGRLFLRLLILALVVLVPLVAWFASWYAAAVLGLG